jgi:hypothetical protein
MESNAGQERRRERSHKGGEGQGQRNMGARSSRVLIWARSNTDRRFAQEQFFYIDELPTDSVCVCSREREGEGGRGRESEDEERRHPSICS